MITRHAVVLSLAPAVMGASLVLGLARAHADTVTVDGHDYPVCAVEDCSDQPGHIGVWFNDGRAWLSLGPRSIPITRCYLGCSVSQRPTFT